MIGKIWPHWHCQVKQRRDNQTEINSHKHTSLHTRAKYICTFCHGVLRVLFISQQMFHFNNAIFSVVAITCMNQTYSVRHKYFIIHCRFILLINARTRYCLANLQ